jgi:hypothetical protein
MSDHIIDMADVTQAFEEMLEYTKEYGRRHDLRGTRDGGNKAESAAIAEAMLKFVGVTTSEDFTREIDGMTMATRLGIVKAIAMGRAGLLTPEAINRQMAALVGSAWLTAFTTGIQLGRKFPKS